MKNKILILGNGFIANRLHKNIEKNTIICPQRINSFKVADRIFKKYKPAIAINCIGSIGRRNVDDCEINKDKTLLSNSYAPIILAEAAIRHKLKLIHIGSGCIFHYDYSSDRPISECKIPDCFDLFYSRSKIYAERVLEVLSSSNSILIVRPRIPLDCMPYPKNLLTKLLNFKKVIDIPNSVTYMPDFIEALKHLITIDARGIYNVVNKGTLRYPVLLDVYKRFVPDFKYKILNYNKLKLKRSNLILSVRKLERSGFKVRSINQILEECVKNYIKF
ncbi:sugar nucleotide-binding protein [Thermoproteota archaeon]